MSLDKNKIGLTVVCQGEQEVCMSTVEKIKIERDVYETSYWRFVYPSCVRAFDKEYNQIAESSDYGIEIEEVIDKLEVLLKKCPDYLDAYHSLGACLLDCFEIDSAIQVWKKGFELINSILHSDFKPGKDRINYHVYENRAYFRVCSGMAHGLMARARVLNRELLKAWDYEEAIKIFEILLKVYPNDNVGARTELPECYLYLHKYQEILNLLRKYPDGASHELEYGSVLAALRLNHTKQASKLLDRAITHTPLVGEILLLESPKEPDAEEYSSNYTTCGSGFEAYRYWEDYNCFWDDKAKFFLTEGRDLIETVKSKQRSLWGSALPEEYRKPYPKHFTLEGCGIC